MRRAKIDRFEVDVVSFNTAIAACVHGPPNFAGFGSTHMEYLTVLPKKTFAVRYRKPLKLVGFPQERKKVLSV